MRIHITQDTKTYLDEIGGFITHLKPEHMRAVRQAIQFALGFDTVP